MALDIICPICGETEELVGRRVEDQIEITCGSCGQTWQRPTTPTCAHCDGADLQAVPLAIVERSRGTQLSVVGIRIVHLCTDCDAEVIERWQRNRPNPLLPDELPTTTGDRPG
jgi:transposase-like protein